LGNVIGTSFATAGFSYDANISPNNQSFSGAVLAVTNRNPPTLALPGTATFIGLDVTGTATISTLQVTTATIATENVSTATITELSVTGTATINQLQVGTATIANLVTVSGTFTGTLSGMTTTVTVPCVYTIVGKICVLSVGEGNSAYLGTSNATTMNLAPVPAAIQPATLTQNIPYTGIQNAGNYLGGNGLMLVTAGNGTFQFFIGETGAFQATLGKGIAQQTLSYLLN
jgi:hypothetical protein